VFKTGRIHEKFLYEIWKSNGLVKELKTWDSQKIEIIDSGENNKDFAGPDFFNSRIKIGSITFNGDVEIDFRHSDWKSHGHYLDKKYNKVILHVVLSKEKFQPFVFTEEGRKVNSICIVDLITDDLQSTVRKAIDGERTNRAFDMPCTELNKEIEQSVKLKFLSDLGIERFKEKEIRIFSRLKEMVYLKQMNIREPVVLYDFGEDFHSKKFTSEEFNDPLLWQQLIYELTFEALGYAKNKQIMLALAKAVNIDFLMTFSSDKKFLEKTESALFNVSGILGDDYLSFTDDAAEYMRNLVENWSSIKGRYDGLMFSKEKWNYFKLRPQNFPTVRLAGGSRLVIRLLKDDVLGKIINLFSNDINNRKLTAALRNLFIIKTDGFWQTHYVFNKSTKEIIKYFVGLSRADEMIINVVLPALAVYFEIFENSQASRRVKLLYINYQQKSSNNIVDQVENSLYLNECGTKSVHIQGMIELFKHYCVKEKCLKCEIGKIVFS
jgi:hypothetical protein